MSLGSSSTPDFPASEEPASKDPLLSGEDPFEIADWLVEPGLLQLSRGGDVHKLEPMAMRLLVFLAQRPGEVLARSEILEVVWEGRAVVDETLSRGMSLVRQALGDSAQEPTYIETLPRRGYRLIAPVKSLSREPEPAAPHRQRILVLIAILFALAVLWLGWASWPGGTVDNRDASPGSTVPRQAEEARQRPGIVVLSFKNLSPDPANTYLAEGLTEELTHQLAGVSGLRVVSRTSSLHFRDSDALASEIAETLGVDYLLEGTVLVVGERLRITAQLIRPDQDDHLLSRSYDRDLSEVLDVQREVAKDVVEQTRTRLSPKETIRLSRDRPVDSEAYRTYLQGHQTIQRRRDISGGLELLERAVGLDPDFAPAWAALAGAHLLANSYAGWSEGEAYAGAEAAIERALALDPDLPAAHASLGLLRLQRDRDWSGSEEAYQRAISLEPSYVTARQWYSELLSLLRRHEEAIEQVNIALELDPLSPLVHAAAGQRLNAAGRYEDALRRLEDVEALGADFYWHLREKSWTLARLGREEESLRVRLDKAKNRGNLEEARLAALERAIADDGLVGYYAWELEGLLSRPQQAPGYPTWLAAAYAGVGQDEKALEWLAKAAQKRNLWLLHTLKNPAFDTLRDDPRFAKALGDLPPWRIEPNLVSRAP